MYLTQTCNMIRNLTPGRLVPCTKI